MNTIDPELCCAGARKASEAGETLLPVSLLLHVPPLLPLQGLMMTLSGQQQGYPAQHQQLSQEQEQLPDQHRTSTLPP